MVLGGRWASREWTSWQSWLAGAQAAGEEPVGRGLGARWISGSSTPTRLPPSLPLGAHISWRGTSTLKEQSYTFDSLYVFLDTQIIK